MKHLFNIYAAMAALLVLGACSSSSDGDEPAAKGQVTDCPYILFGFSNSTASIGWSASTQSRGGSDIPAVMPESLGIFGYNNFSGGQSYKGGGEVFSNVELYWRGGELFKQSGINAWLKNPDTGQGLPTDGADNMWPYSPPMPWLNEAEGVKYKFFGYSPYTPYGTDIEAYGRSYDSFESIEWRHIPKYSARDYMISDRILEYTSSLSGNTLQVLTMRHLQARIRFCFKLGAEFSQLRMIRVKKIEVVALRGFLYTLTVRYTPHTEGGETVLRPSLTWGIEEGTDPSDQELTNEADPVTLKPIPYIEMSRDKSDYQALASVYAFPNDDLSALQIKVTYDVYDYYPDHGKEPVLLRENDVAQNNVPLSFRSAFSESGTGPKLQAGYYYDVRIKIEPSFLYVLSDNDFDTDGYLIINDD